MSFYIQGHFLFRNKNHKQLLAVAFYSYQASIEKFESYYTFINKHGVDAIISIEKINFLPLRKVYLKYKYNPIATWINKEWESKFSVDLY